MFIFPWVATVLVNIIGKAGIQTWPCIIPLAGVCDWDMFHSDLEVLLAGRLGISKPKEYKFLK